jgi:hypothetical protein
MSNTTLETKVVVAGVRAGIRQPAFPVMGNSAGFAATGIRRPF